MIFAQHVPSVFSLPVSSHDALLTMMSDVWYWYCAIACIKSFHDHIEP